MDPDALPTIDDVESTPLEGRAPLYLAVQQDLHGRLGLPTP